MSGADKDDYPTCHRTVATLRVYSGSVSPAEVTRILDLQPTHTQVTGGMITRRIRAFTCPTSGWFLSSTEHVQSFDASKHLRWLLDRLQGRESKLLELKDAGFQVDVVCYWESEFGDGGPEVSPEIARQLAAFKLPLRFDVYFGAAFEWVREVKAGYGTN